MHKTVALIVCGAAVSACWNIPGLGGDRPKISVEMAEDGGLMAYGASFSHIYRQAAKFVIKVFRGENPGDIPAEQPTNFELIINLKTAQAIGHNIPTGLSLRADKIIE